MAAPVYASQSAIASVTMTTLTVDTPSGTTAGDLLLAHLVWASGGSAVTSAPDGWTPVVAAYDDLADLGQTVYVRVAEAGEPSSYAWVFDAAGTKMGAISRITGADPATPVNASALEYESFGGSSIVVPQITTTVDACLLVHLVGRTESGYPIDAADGYSEQYDDAIFAATKEMANAGLTPSDAEATALGLGALAPRITTHIAIAPVPPINLPAIAHHYRQMRT